jgi:O-antigen ligase
LGQALLLGSTPELTPQKVFLGLMIMFVGVAWSLPVLFDLGRWIEQPLARWILLVLFLCFASRITGAVNHIKTIDWARDFTTMMNYVWTFYVLLGFKLHQNIRRLYAAVLVVVGVFTVYVTTYYLQIRGFTEGTDWSRNIRPSDGVVLFGTFMSLGMANASTGKIRRRWLLVNTAFLLATLLTGTRTHLIALPAGYITVAWLLIRDRNPGARRMLLGLVAPAVIALSLFVGSVATGLISKDAVLDRIEKAEEGTEAMTIVNRIQEARDSIQVFSKHPIFGVGLGYKLGEVFVIGHSLDPQDDYFIHNFYLYVLVKFGLVGVFVFGGFLMSPFITAVKGYRRADSAFERGIFGGIAGLMASLYVESLAANRFSDRTSTALMAMVFAMLMVLYRPYVGRKKPDSAHGRAGATNA